MSRLRRLRDSQQRAEGDAGTRHSAREDRFRFRHRLFVALSLLHEHLRLSHHSWPRAGNRHRDQVCQSGTERLGDHWRWRRAFDRRQPLHACDSPQPRSQLHSLQQPHLWFDERPIQSHLGVWQEDQVDAGRRDRLSDQSAFTRDRQRVDFCRTFDRHRCEASGRHWSRRLPDTKAFPLSRSIRTATSSTITLLISLRNAASDRSRALSRTRQADDFW